jgi:hypothetical protein
MQEFGSDRTRGRFIGVPVTGLGLADARRPPLSSLTTIMLVTSFKA